jgi:hypothetical protein
MPIKHTLAPTVEPITLAEAKLHLRVDATDDDALIGSLISAARFEAEHRCSRALVTQQWELSLDSFPRRMFFGSVTTIASYQQVIPNLQMLETGYTVRFRAGKIEIPFPRLQSVDYVKYLDTNGVRQTLDPTLYIVDAVSEPGIIAPAYDTFWPDSRSVPNAVQIGFTCGYGLAAAVPDGIKAWMKIFIATLYENREQVAILPRGKVEPLPYVDRLLDPYTVPYL